MCFAKFFVRILFAECSKFTLIVEICMYVLGKKNDDD